MPPLQTELVPKLMPMERWEEGDHVLADKGLSQKGEHTLSSSALGMEAPQEPTAHRQHLPLSSAAPRPMFPRHLAGEGGSPRNQPTLSSASRGRRV